MLAFFDPRRLRRMAHLDGLAVLAFLVSYLLLADQHLYAAVWLAYPPLLYLLVRMLVVGFGRGGSPGRLAPLLSIRTLLIGLPLLIAGRIVLSLVGHQEIDVGYESVIGAFRILHHAPLYYNDPNHGDTYGPIAYLAYVPFQLLFPWKQSLSNLHAADAAAIFFDLGTMLGLFLLGRRLRRGREGTRFGLILAWAWAACPFTVIGLTVHTNDGLVSMLSVFALLALSSPVLSGGLLGLATAAKFSPAAMLPVLASPRQRGVKGTALYVGAFAGVVGLAIFSWLPPKGLGYFWQRTISFQLHRVDVFSPWALHPSLHPLQTALEVIAVLLVIALAFVPRERSLPAVCALAGAVTIAIQLPATHWYYYYIMWFLPFALVAFVARTTPVVDPAVEAARREWVIQPTEQGPAMVGA
jgi:type IV secretory pathway TrbD component